jgi:hypothetical protein
LSTAPIPRHRLSARVFYGVIVAGVLLGTLISAAAAWAYLEAGDRQPTARRIWGDVATMFVIPVAVMIGATFGGLIGFATAAVLDRKRRHIVLK